DTSQFVMLVKLFPNMKKIKQIIFFTFVFVFLAGAVAQAGLTGPTGNSGLTGPAVFCAVSANVWVFCNTSDEFGDSSNPIADGNFTSLTIGTVVISASVSGELIIQATSTSALQVGSETNTQVFNVDTTNQDVWIRGNMQGSSVSDVFLVINNASSTAADVYVDFQIASSTAWRIGVDDSDSNKFRIAQAGFSATSSGITINAAGFVGIGTTNPSTAFNVSGVATFSNVTTSLRGIPYGWPANNGDASQRLTTDGAGILTWETVTASGGSNFVVETNFGTSTVTASTSIAFWSKRAIFASTTLRVGGILTVNTDVVPLTDSTSDLGTSSKYFQNAYIDNLFVQTDGSIAIAQGTGVTVNAAGEIAID
ncbi:hypothetical protein LCGC14_2996780, partial [marine sediment metagenome]